MNPIEELLIALRRVIRATDLHSKHLAKTTGLTAPQILLMQTVRDRAPLTIGEIAAVMSLSQATVTTIIDRLEKRGLLYRQRAEHDKRKVFVRLHSSGKKVLEKAPIPLQDQLSQQFATLQDWEQNMIIASLQRVAQMMDAQELDAAPVLDVGVLDRQDNPAEAGPDR